MHITLVEPSKIGQSVVTRLLEQHGHNVVSFQNGKDAFAHITRGEKVDALLTSLETEGMGGLELCWHTRIITEENRPIYILAMSSSLEISKAVEALDSGADDIIRKPPIPEELLAKLRAAERLAAMQKRLIIQATIDNLTGILNRGAFFQIGEPAMLNTRKSAPTSLIMLDIDKFKSVNDTYGHQVGDIAIRLVADTIKAKWQYSSTSWRRRIRGAFARHRTVRSHDAR